MDEVVTHRPAALRRPTPIWLGAWLALLLLAPDWSGAQSTEQLVRDDGRMRGDPNAPVTLIEYSDFTCGYCGKFFRETWPRIQANYVQTGKVRFLYRDYPRAFRGPGLTAAVAARCAGDQSRYWVMHDRLFGSGVFTFAMFKHHATRIGLDLPSFTKCVREGHHAEAIFDDRAEGVQLGFRGTPGFLLLRTQGAGEDPAVTLPGAFPYEVFQEQIERLLGAPTEK